ncbi:MAG: hypothetical protein KJZ80_17500 [Hyphomicrobiaceae bacterium]|nr:hypothetical protein [Hyphomicrobiaceae bacterium]
MTAKQGVAAAVMLLTLGAAGQAVANRINTGEEAGTYHARFCPELSKHLTRARLDYTCTTSPGTAENVRRVAADPLQIGFGQLDVFAREAAKLADPAALVQVRTDDVRQCLFAVTRHRDLQSFGELAVLAPDLRFFLPPQDSGSADTFRILQHIDADGLGRAKSIEHSASPDEAIRLALSAEDSVAFFVQFPDPDNSRFRMVRELGGHYVPIIDREILRQLIDGHKVYFAQETQVSNADWLASARKVVTACTPMVLFTGPPERIPEAKPRQDHEDLIATVRSLRTEALLPQEDTFARVLNRTKELSAASAEQLMRASEKARERAKPYIESAKEATDKALDAAKPAIEKAKDYGLKFYERAREELKQLMAPKPGETPAEQPRQ